MRIFSSALPFALLLGVSLSAQSPTYHLGRTPTPDEVRAWDIADQPGRPRAAAGSRHGEGRTGRLHREGMRPVPRAQRRRRQSTDVDRHERRVRPARQADAGNGHGHPGSRPHGRERAVRDDDVGLHQQRDAARTRGIASSRTRSTRWSRFCSSGTT